MANTAANVRVAVTGSVSVGAYAATAPTSVSSVLSAHDDLGYCDESGVVLAMPGAGDSTTLRAWQNGDPVRVLRTPSEDLPTVTVNFMETSIKVVEYAFGVTIAQTATDGSFAYKVTNRTPKSVVIDVADGTDLIRLYVPQAVITEMADITLVSTDAIKFGVTFACELDAGKDFNFKGFFSSFKSS